MKLLAFFVPTVSAVGLWLTACGGQVADDAIGADRQPVGSASGSGHPAPSGSSYVPPTGSSYVPPPGSSYVPPTGSSYVPPPGSSYVPPAPPPFPWASACPNTAPASEPRPMPEGGAAEMRAYIDAMRTQMVGHWRGITSTPWEPAYPVYLALEADGTYATRSLGPLPALYYGTDLDTPLKTWTLDDASPYGVASGSIAIAFDYGNGWFDVAGWSGELHDVTLDAAGTRLQLSYTTSNGYGPIELDLWRCD